MILDSSYKIDEIFFRWLYGFLVILGLFYLLIYYGLISELVKNDASYISLLILSVFLLSTVVLGYHVYLLNNCLIKFRIFFNNGSKIEDYCQLKNNDYYQSCINEYILNSTSNTKSLSMSLDDDFEIKLYKHHNLFSLISDIFIRLGLVGTVIGFIIMLQSLSDLENFDINLMQNLLKDMSLGMMVALYTTLTGLITAIILTLQNKYLESVLFIVYSSVINHTHQFIK